MSLHNKNFHKKASTENWAKNWLVGLDDRLTSSVPVFALFIEFDDGTPLQVELIIKLSEICATNEIAEFQTITNYVPTDQWDINISTSFQ